MVVRHVEDDLAVTERLLAYLGEPYDDRFDDLALQRTRHDVVASADGAADAARCEIDRWCDVYRRSSALPSPLLDEAAAWLRRRATAFPCAADAPFWAAFHQFARACAQLACLVELGGPCPSPEQVIVGTAVQQMSMRRLAELIA